VVGGGGGRHAKVSIVLWENRGGTATSAASRHFMRRSPPAVLTSSPRLKPGDSNPSPGRASCFIGPRLPGRLRGRSYRPSAGVLPLRQPGGEDVTCGVDVPVMGRAAG